MSKEFSRTENRILGALARLDDFLMNPLIQGHSETTPEMSRNAFSTNQGTNGDDSQSDLHPESGILGNQTRRNSGQEDGRDMLTGFERESLCQRDRDMVTGVQRESLCGRDMVTGATEQIGNHHDMTGVHEKVTHCSFSTS